MKRILIAAGVFALAACSAEPAAAPAPMVPPAPETATAPSQEDPLLSAMGIGVSDLAKSTDFYVNVMGMEKTRSITIDDME